MPSCRRGAMNHHELLNSRASTPTQRFETMLGSRGVLGSHAVRRLCLHDRHGVHERPVPQLPFNSHSAVKPLSLLPPFVIVALNLSQGRMPLCGLCEVQTESPSTI